MRPEQAEVYRCDRDEMHKTAFEAAKCNLYHRLDRIIKEQKETSMGGRVGFRTETEQMLEGIILSHWIANKPCDLEELIHKFLEDSDSGNMDKVKS